jgi:glycosyltransferase involved in cell wall biosynthesis
MKVTVLMSVYNGERYVRDGIASILGQTLEDFEFLIINDGSTDQSREIILSFKDKRIRFIDHDQNQGLSRRLAEGVTLAHGEFIARIDADDIAYSTRLSIQLNALESEPLLGLVGSWYELEDMMSGKRSQCRRHYSHALLKWNLLFGNVFGHSTIMMRKEACLAAGNYDAALEAAQDYDLWSRIARIQDVKMVPHLLGKIRIHAESISARKTAVQDQRVEDVTCRNIAAVVKGRLSWNEIRQVSCLMRRAEVPNSQKERFSLVEALNTLIECFASQDPKRNIVSTIKYDCSVRVLNSHPQSVSWWQRWVYYAFSLHLSVKGTFGGLLSKIIRKVNFHEDSSLLLSNP